jgi:hypothetical protein
VQMTLNEALRRLIERHRFITIYTSILLTLLASSALQPALNGTEASTSRLLDGNCEAPRVSLR